MTVLVGEGDDLRLDARAVAGADTLDLTIVQRRAVEGLTQDGVAGLIGIERIAGELTQRRAGGCIEVGELMMIVLALLHAHLIEVQATGIDTWGRTRLHAVGADTRLLQLLGDAVGSWLGDTTTRDLQLTEVHQPREEGPRGQDDGIGGEVHTQLGLYATHTTLLEGEARDGILPLVE